MLCHEPEFVVPLDSLHDLLVRWIVKSSGAQCGYQHEHIDVLLRQLTEGPDGARVKDCQSLLGTGQQSQWIWQAERRKGMEIRKIQATANVAAADQATQTLIDGPDPMPQAPKFLCSKRQIPGQGTLFQRPDI